MRNATIITTLVLSMGAGAQGPMDISLRQAMALAATQSYAVRTSVLEAEKANKRINEVMAIGLPQVNASASLANWIEVPIQVVPNFFGGEPKLLEAQFALPWAANAGIRLDQLLFDGTYIIGLQATRELRKQSEEELERAAKDAQLQAAKSYFAVLAADEGARLIDETVPVLERSLRESEVMVENGFMESTDVDRLRIEVANMRDQRLIFQRQAELARNMLRFVLGLPANTPLRLTDALDKLMEDPEETNLDKTPFDLNQHVDSRIAGTIVRLQTLQMRKEKAAYLPTLNGFLSHQQQYNDLVFQPIDGEIPWFPASQWGVGLNVPIFSSGMRSNRVAQARIGLEQAEVNREMTEQRLRLEYDQRLSDVTTAQALFNSERERLRLSKSVFERTSVKFTEGVASSFELTTEQNNYITIQQNYINRIATLVNARAELRRALDRF
ncbi:MAG: TolC family protein [Flavobacteriales bacterium]|nr:TolC family protein [Flavobacteriales bacterium]